MSKKATKHKNIDSIQFMADKIRSEETYKHNIEINERAVKDSIRNTITSLQDASKGEFNSFTIGCGITGGYLIIILILSGIFEKMIKPSTIKQNTRSDQASD